MHILAPINRVYWLCVTQYAARTSHFNPSCVLSPLTDAACQRHWWMDPPLNPAWSSVMSAVLGRLTTGQTACIRSEYVTWLSWYWWISKMNDGDLNRCESSWFEPVCLCCCFLHQCWATQGSQKTSKHMLLLQLHFLSTHEASKLCQQPQSPGENT